MLILSIETSCDDTSLALLQTNLSVDQLGPDLESNFFGIANSWQVLASLVSSQIEIHKNYGGVVPELGARNHASQIHFLLQKLVDSVDFGSSFGVGSVGNVPVGGDDVHTKLTFILSNLDHIAVTSQPGLKSALRVGVEFAKTLKFFINNLYGKNLQILEVNHLQGHILSSFYKQNLSKSEYGIIVSEPFTLTESVSVFPHLHLLVSGGNSQLLMFQNPTNWQILGQTLDDAAGECFDKVGRMLGLFYPAGVWISKIAGLNNYNSLEFTVGMLKSHSLDYSFSGLKTAVRYYLQKQSEAISDFKLEKNLTQEELELLLSLDKNPELLESCSPKIKLIYDVCVSVQCVIIKQLLNKLKLAINKYEPRSLGLSGGVSASPLLRQQLELLWPTQSTLFIPHKLLTGDNAIMIGLAGGMQVFYEKDTVDMS